MNHFSSHPSLRVSAFLSLVVPGLGLFVRGYFQQALQVLIVSLILALTIWWSGEWGGTGTRIFGGVLFFLPWWIFQSFHTSVSVPRSMVSTWNCVWEYGHDIRYLGGLFLFSAVMDLYIIVGNPEYQLQVFCTRPSGIIGLMTKLQSPFFHVFIGYGFLHLTRWGLFVYLVYASYGLMNVLANFACEGYGRIRTVFFFTLLFFTVYVFVRRKCFIQGS